jgi:hypothetical protein
MYAEFDQNGRCIVLYRGLAVIPESAAPVPPELDDTPLDRLTLVDGVVSRAQ